jgi:hypothetical protein
MLLPKGVALRKEFIDSGYREATASGPLWLLFDDGSLQPDAILNLRGSS